MKRILFWAYVAFLGLAGGYGMYKHAECQGLYSWSPQPAGQVCE